MSIARRLATYGAHADPVTAACNRIALLVASGQPSYPLYVWWVVGGPWQVACWTFLSTPLFLAVPAVARRRAMAGRMLLVVAGVANAVLATCAMGEASGVELFLIPTTLIAVLAFRGAPRSMIALVVLNGAAALLHGHHGAAWGHFTAVQNVAFVRLNLWSVVVLSAVSAWALIRASPASR